MRRRPRIDPATRAANLLARRAGPEHAPGALGAVVLHGFTGAPWDVEPVALALGEAGIGADVPVLAGHAEGVAGIRRTTLDDWRADVDRAIATIVEATGRPALVAGLSMGALLGLDAALRHPERVAGVAALAAPLAFGVAAVQLARASAGAAGGWLHDLAWPKLGGSDISNGLAVGGADAIPFRALDQVIRLVGDVRRDHARLSRPLLVVHARADHTAPVWSAHRLANAHRAPFVRLVILDTGFHVITRDVCADRVASEVVTFAQRIASGMSEGAAQAVGAPSPPAPMLAT